ncbi:MAG: aspartate-semialdehyde dehydrogenase [Tissierellia bacterium]|nr:aspartate-semialdehyde dehydrogenase [Tissierellia bacterium]
MSFNLAILGATGLVGQKMRQILEDKDLPIREIHFFASERSKGKIIEFKGKDYEVEVLSEENFKRKNIDYALCALGSGLAQKFLPLAAANNIRVIDNSSAFRMKDDIPLVVPEINIEAINKEDKIIASPNCSTIQSVVALKPIYEHYGIKRIVYTTYQAVSGSGKEGIQDLKAGLKGEKNQFYPYQIAGNILPHIDDFLDSGYTKEEMKMVHETKKIFNDDSLKITATAVRIPVFDSHAVAINVETIKPFQLEDIFSLYEKEEGIVLYDNVKENIYPMPIITTGKDPVYVGRIRRDNSIEHGLNIFCVADNTRKGAALNTIQILEKLI